MVSDKLGAIQGGKVSYNLLAAQAACKRDTNRIRKELRGWFLCQDLTPLWQNAKSKERCNSVTNPPSLSLLRRVRIALTQPREVLLVRTAQKL